MSKHTPDFTNLRLTVDETGESGIGNIQDLNGNSVAMVQEPAIKRGIERNQFRQKLAIEIAKRWNACAGIADPAAEIAKLKADRERLINFVRLIESSVSAANPESVIGKAAKLLIEEMEAQK